MQIRLKRKITFLGAFDDDEEKYEYLDNTHEFGFTEHLEYAYKFDSLEAVEEYFTLAADKFAELGEVELEVTF